jgi:monovalent cation:H+ antiporter, CPA1 family
MTLFESCTILFAVSAMVGYINVRILKLPLSVALMLAGILLSFTLVALAKNNVPTAIELVSQINAINFSEIVLDVMLCFLLFAGALQTDFVQLQKNKNRIALFSVASTIINAILLAAATYVISSFCSLKIDLQYCLLLGAILSPTDPIAILGLLSKINIPSAIKTTIVGESLFNDAVGVVLFICVLTLCGSSASLDFGDALKVFLQQAIGGILLGYFYGIILNYLVHSIDDYEVEILITIGICMGGYWIAHLLHTSGPLAMVIAGILAGKKSQQTEQAVQTEKHVLRFWHLVDVVLNALLFLLMGLKVISLVWQADVVVLALVLIPLGLLARYFSLCIPYLIARKWLPLNFTALKLMTWGGLRGGLSIAMAMSLSANFPHKNTFLICTYGIVIFSIFVQALTTEKVARNFANNTSNKNLEK